MMDIKLDQIVEVARDKRGHARVSKIVLDLMAKTASVQFEDTIVAYQVSFAEGQIGNAVRERCPLCEHGDGIYGTSEYCNHRHCDCIDPFHDTVKT